VFLVIRNTEFLINKRGVYFDREIEA
jgi:hypothetical protein